MEAWVINGFGDGRSWHSTCICSDLMLRVIRAHRSWLSSGAIFVVLLLALAAMACLSHDADMDHHHAMPPDLCLGLLVVSFMPVVLARPFVVGWALVVSLAPAYVTTLHIPDPPPKSRTLP